MTEHVPAAMRARIVEIGPKGIACDHTIFSTGGGGQPPDRGVMTCGAEEVPVISVVGEGGVVWHVVASLPRWAVSGAEVGLSVDVGLRRSVARYHTALHILNTIVRRDHGGWITGAAIGEDGARIDFSLDRLTPELVAAIEHRARDIIDADLPIGSYLLEEESYRMRPELRRTLDVEPPIVEGKVRVVEIAGFDEQACGGHHVASTREVGKLSVVRTENKGKRNKRLYVHLAEEGS